MGLALYRRYRPRTFAEVIGQEHVTEPLMQALRTGRLNHAYLFSGPRGCGKTSSARILARSLNCERGPTPEPCGECDSCVALAPDGSGSIDVIEIDAASHGGVDDARDLRERAIFAPVSSRFKVYVIDEAHMVSSAGFNALLKLVEEPPDYVKFVFATTEPDKVLGTIKSRTHHYPFRLITPGVLRPYLEKLCAIEGVKVEPAVFPLVVRAGGGSARDTLSVLDQLIAGAGPEGVTYPRAVALLGVTDVALLDEMCDALAAGDGAAAYGTIDRVVEAGHDPRRFASDLLGRLRDLIVLQQVPDAAGKGLLDAPDDELTRMASQAQRFGPATLSRLADIVHDGLTEMRGTTAPRLLLELICARMLLPGADDSAGALLQRLERMERRLAATGEPPTPTPTPTPTSEAPQTRTAPQNQPEPQGTTAPQSKPEPPSQAEPQDDRDNGEPQAAAVAVKTAAPERPGVLDAVAVRRVWEEILGYVGRKSRRVGAVAREATVREVAGDTLVLLFKHRVHAEMLAGGPELLIEAVYEVLGPPAPDRAWQVRCELSGQAVSPGTASDQGPKPPVPPAQSRRDAPAAEPDWPATAPPGGATPAPRPDPSPAPATAPRKAGGRAAGNGRKAAAEPAEEPPDEPYEGFDPGDEPLDDVLDEQTVRQTSEEQALQLLRQTLGAEKIG